ncbi:MAG: wax ester/triacylglycerol synthase domain-containing protein [Acidimicrobiales bacterium]
MASPPQELTARRMNGAEALMWALDADPALRSSFLSITFLDGPPDGERWRARMLEAVGANPIMSQRVVSAPLDLANPRWEHDPGFDIDYHLRHIALPPPGDRRQLLDLAALLYADPFDRTRPLWQFTLVDGLEDGGAALLAKMHHVISDGIGAVRLSVSFLDLSPDGDSLAGPPRAAVTPPSRNLFETLVPAVTGTIGSVVRAPATVRSLGRQLAVLDPARSPLWTDRSYAHRFDTVSIDLDRIRAVGKVLGGSVNDVYVTMVVGAAGEYHRRLGQPVEELRMAMPISVRHDKEVAGNAWVPARLLVPAGEVDPAARFAALKERIASVRREPGAGLTEPLAAVVRHVPSPVLLRLVRQQTGTVDFACSNVRGAPFDLWISGAHVEANHPMGPTAGAAFNATVLSYRDSLDLGLNCDTGAIADPALLRSCIEDAADAVLALA